MSEKQIEKNKVVTFVYLIADENGEVLEQSDIPHSYVHDQDERMFPKVIQALEGHRIGDEVEVTLSPEEGFGHYDPGLTFSDDLNNVPPEYHRIGAEAEFKDEAGQSLTMRVTKMENGRIELDGNPPFVDRTVVFTINVLDIRDATGPELAASRVDDSGQMPSLH